MRAVRVREPGGVDVLDVVDIPLPIPGAREVLVRNFATALNRADLLQRRGLYPPPPGESDILGLEFAGEVAELGPGATLHARGDRVFGLVGGGGYGEFLRVDERLAVRIPDTLSYDAAAAIPEVFYTAGEALFTLGGLVAGQSVLVHAGASGVGTAALQLARQARAAVLTTVGSAEKAARCLDLGAGRAVNYHEEDFAAAAAAWSGGNGVDVVLDLVGAKYWEANLRVLKDGGRLLVVGLLGGAKVNVDLWTLLRRRLSILGTSMRGRSLEDKIAITDRFRERVLPLLGSGVLRAVIDRVYSLDEVRQAHERMEANLNFGKIVLRL